MENKTNLVLNLGSAGSYYILRQALYKGKTYYLVAELTKDKEDFTNKILFLERYFDENEKEMVQEVTDHKILEVLAKNIKIEEL